MSLALVNVAFIGYGDVIRLEGREYLVSYIDGPDRGGTYDLYLVDQGGNPHHKVVADPIELEV